MLSVHEWPAGGMIFFMDVPHVLLQSVEQLVDTSIIGCSPFIFLVGVGLREEACVYSFMCSGENS
jgi:hypothetical protein